MSSIQDRLQAAFPIHYRSGSILLLNADNMEVMKHIRDVEFELSCVDPPYGIGEAGGELHSNRALNGAGKLKNRALNKLNTKWDIAPNQNYFDELFRISQHQIVWGGNYFNLPPTRGFAVWDKCQPWPNFSAAEFAWSSFDCPSKLFKFDNRTSDKIHPTQKPIALYEWLLTNYAKPGDKILDTHLGSGSSAIAAHKLGYEFVGIELDKDYFEAACKRIEDAQRITDMFAAQPKPEQSTIF